MVEFLFRGINFVYVWMCYAILDHYPILLKNVNYFGENVAFIEMHCQNIFCEIMENSLVVIYLKPYVNLQGA